MKAMKRILYLSFVTLQLALFTACGLSDIDNYEGPNATISGGLYDVETGELIQQDVIRGAQIEYIELGFKNPQTQYIVVKNEGTYRNNLMFANRYTIQPVRGNFVPVEKQEIEVSGSTVKDFKVQPYIRIKNAVIKQMGDKVVATFKVQQTVENPVKRIGLFAHQEINVGEPLNIVNKQEDINVKVDENHTYQLEIDLVANNSKLVKGKSYYFRVGALIDASEAKYNYASTIQLTVL
jgi:hypothetical protein